MTEYDNAFISYGRADSKDFATKLYEKLTEKGLKIWFDQNDIPLAVDFQNEIDNGIIKADNFLFIIAPHSVNSPYCLKEIELAVKYNKRIIPLLHVEQITYEIWQQRNPQGTLEEWENYQQQGKHSIFPNMHPEIGRINWVPFRENLDDFDKSFLNIIKIFNNHRNYVKQHTNLLFKALEWQQNHQQNRYILTGKERQEAESWLNIQFTEEQPPCLPTDLHCEFICESIKNANNLMTQVFLSYANTDKEVMDKVRKSLMRSSMTIWTNKTDIKTGQDFQAEINHGIERADNLVYLLSEAALKSEYCQQEIAYALSLNKRIISLLVEPIDLAIIPLELRSLQFIDLTAYQDEREYDQSLDKLIKELQENSVYYLQHKVLLVKAIKWQKQNRNNSILLRGYNLEHYQSWLEVAVGRSVHPPTPLQIEFIAESAKQPPTLNLDVFISYSRTDAEFGRKLNDALQTQGKTTWFDQESIATGTDFQQEIHRGIEQSDNFLFIISPNSVNSPYCADEVEYARKLNKRFITILYRPIEIAKLHPELAKVQWLDFNKQQGDFYTNFSQLIRTLDTDREYVHSHTKWSQQALEWEQQNRCSDLLLRGSELAIAYSWLQQAEQENKQPPPTTLQQSFITKSHQYKNRKQIVKIAAFASVLIVVTVAGIISTVFAIEAKRQTRRAEKQVAIAKAMLAKNQLQTQPLKGVLQAIEATGSSLSSLPQVPAEVQSSLQEATIVLKRKIIERHIFRGHQARVRSVAFSPDGKYIVSGSWDKTIRLWDREGKPIGKPFRGHEKAIISVSVSPDGEYIVSGSDDHTLRLWDRQGNPIGKTLTGHENTISSVAVSADSKYIVSGSWDNTVRLWDREGKPIGKPFQGHEKEVVSVAFSPDGQYIVSGSGDNTLRLWNIQGKSMGVFKGHQGHVIAVAFSPDGQYIVSGSSDRTLRLWNLKGELIGQPFKGHEDHIWSVAFSPDGKYIVSGGWDNTVRLWNLQGDPIAQPWRGHEDVIWSVAFSPDGQYIASGGTDKTIRLWELQENPLTKNKPLIKHEKTINSVAFSPNGKYIAIGSENNVIQLWDTEGNLIGKPFQGHEGTVWSVAFSPDGKYIVSGSDDHTIRLWDLQGTQIGEAFQRHKGTIWSVKFSPDGKYIVSGSDDKTIRLWDLQGNLIGQPFVGHEKAVTAVVFSPNSKLIYSGSSDRTVRVWDRKGNSIGQPFVGHDGPIYSMAIDPNGEYIVTGSQDHTVRLWSPEGEALGTPLEGHKHPVYFVAVSSDGESIVSGSEDHTVRLWSRDGSSIGQPLNGHEDAVYSVAFSPNGEYIATGSRDQTVRLWTGKWSIWLAEICQELRLHSVLVEPQDELAKRAGETCLNYGRWNDREIAEFLVKQHEALEKQGDGAAMLYP